MRISFTMFNAGRKDLKAFLQWDQLGRKYEVRTTQMLDRNGLRYPRPRAFYESILIVNIDGISRTYHMWDYGRHPHEVKVTPAVCRWIREIVMSRKLKIKDSFCLINLILVYYALMNSKRRKALTDKLRSKYCTDLFVSEI